MSTWPKRYEGEGKSHRADTSHSTGPSPSCHTRTAAPVAPSGLLPHHWSSPSPHHRYSGDQEKDAEGRVHAEPGPGLCFRMAQRLRIFSDLGRGKQPLCACCVP